MLHSISGWFWVEILSLPCTTLHHYRHGSQLVTRHKRTSSYDAGLRFNVLAQNNILHAPLVFQGLCHHRSNHRRNRTHFHPALKFQLIFLWSISGSPIIRARDISYFWELPGALHPHGQCSKAWIKQLVDKAKLMVSTKYPRPCQGKKTASVQVRCTECIRPQQLSFVYLIWSPFPNGNQRLA